MVAVAVIASRGGDAPSFSYRMYSTPLMRPLGPISSFVTTACASSVTYSGSSAAIVLSAEYFACTGQIGMHAAFPSQRWPTSGLPTALTGLYPRRGTEFLAWARLDTSTGYSSPAKLTVRPRVFLAMTWSL